MVHYNRVMRVPARILSDNREFKGDSLGIPPLREKINSLTGNLTEQEVVKLAEEFYEEYQAIYKNDKKKWKGIKNNKYNETCNAIWTVQVCKGELKRFINKYKEEQN